MRTLGLAMLALGCGLLAPAAERELTGRVVDANTGEPIARAHITIHFVQGAQPAPEVNLLSDADGTFKITNLPNGGYQVTCDKAGYLPASQGMAGAPPVNSADGKSTTTMIMKLTAQAAVEGTVVDDRDMPAANAFIQLVRQQVVNGRRQWQGTQGAGSDEMGSFRVFGLAAGRYYIAVTARLGGARRNKALAYAPFYYPNATEIAAAQPVDLKAGDEAEIKIRLPEPAPAFTVSGVVVTGSPNVGMSLIRQPSSMGFQQGSGDLQVDQKTKTFRFTHVTPGVYLLVATAQQDNHSPSSANTIVTVGNADVTGIRLEPVDTSLDGTMRMDDGSTSQQRIAGFVSVQSERFSNGGQVDGEGKFHVPGLQPGTYRIFPQMNGPQSCVRSVLSGGRDVRDGITVVAGVTPDPIDIVMSSHCGSIDVSLAPSDATPPPNLTAYLLRKSGDEIVLERQGYQGPRSSDGAQHFLVMGVAPGDYMVYVWPNDAQIEYANAEYMRQFESYGQKVTVTEDSKTTVTLDKPLLIPAKN
jgi:hypothetical protein